MKRILVLLIGIIIFYMITSNYLVKGLEIPNDAIRIRVIPNSNTEYDQNIKVKVKETVQKDMYQLLKNTNNSDEARAIIEENLLKLDKSINHLLIKEKYNEGYKLDFGYNYFPEKKYKGITYASGYYESLVITLGKGDGENWWCVLFPPLCLIEEDANETEYKSLAKKIIDNFSNNTR